MGSERDRRGGGPAARLAFALVLAIGGACAGCGGGSDAGASGRCGDAHLTDVYWAGGGYAYGGWYDATGDPTYDDGTGDWYDPSDDPSDETGTGDDGTSGDPTGDDGASMVDDGTAADDTSGDDSASLSANANARLRATSAPAADANGCYSCTVGCVAGGTGQQAVGVSDSSYADACHAAERALASWAHGTANAHLDRCEHVVTSAPPRVPAAPTVTAAARRAR